MGIPFGEIKAIMELPAYGCNYRVRFGDLAGNKKLREINRIDPISR
jgi:hypothetical protein